MNQIGSCNFSLSLFFAFKIFGRRGQMEKSSFTMEFPVAKAAYSFLQENMPLSFSFPAWNKGRIVCQRSQLKRILSKMGSSSDESRKDKLITLSNSSFSDPGTRTPINVLKSSQEDTSSSGTRVKMRTELATSTV